MSQKLILAGLLTCAFLQGCAQVNSAVSDVVTKADTKQSSHTPKNIIMIVSDGMGPAYTTAYRNFADDPATPGVDPTIFDRMLKGNASTYPAPVSGLVTDSAAAATALATGVKSYNGAIGVDTDKRPIKSVLHQAKEQGMRTGVAVTSQIVHATPASYIAHDESRRNYNAIADDFFDLTFNGQPYADVMIGGGTTFFEREDRDLVAQFIDAGYEYANSYNSLAAIPTGSKVLGLFAPVGLKPVLDDPRKNRLAYMTKHAIKHLENDNGFFLLVEASQVDWAGHANDIASVMAEMGDLALAVAYLEDYVAAHPDTLVVLTADHSTGGLTIGARGDYRWSPEFLKNLKSSAMAMSKTMSSNEQDINWLADQLGFALTSEERAQLTGLDSEQETWFRAITAILDNRTNTGWTTSGHTGVDVEVFAFGAGSDAFLGQMDNTDIAKKIFAALANKPMVKPTVVEKIDGKEPASASEDDAPCDFKVDWRCQ